MKAKVDEKKEMMKEMQEKWKKGKMILREKLEE